ncbi:MAG: hypothetical protein EBY39_07480 [Flavobacteriia bacterium]|nr:hypothetical protein [Flavobacteriia bacterium]
MNKEVYEYIVKQLLNSNAFFTVNGTPEKRRIRIKEYAWHKYLNMDVFEFEQILKQIEINKKNKK